MNNRRGWIGEASRNSIAWLFGICVRRQPIRTAPWTIPAPSSE